MAQFNVAPVGGESASLWFIYWSADSRGRDIAIELTPAILGAEPLHPIQHGPFSLTLEAQTPKLTLARTVWDFPDGDFPDGDFPDGDFPDGDFADGAHYRPLVADLWRFLDAIQEAEDTQLVSGCAQALRATIAARMPCTFAETTLLRCGLFRRAGDEPRSYVALIPGMSLAIDAAVSQFVPSASGPPVGINGYVAAGRTLAELVSTAAGTVVSDPFLAGNTVPAVDAGTGGAGGALDLQAALSAPHLRLCYPRRLAASSGPGSVDLAQNVALLGAGTLAALDTATDAFYNGTPLPAGASGAFFRGRATLTPQLAVTLNGGSLRVAVGTTLRQLVERLTALPRLAGKPTQSSVQIQRVMPRVLYSGGAIASMETVSLGVTPKGAGCDGWDLPVFGGDELIVLRSYAAARRRS